MKIWHMIVGLVFCFLFIFWLTCWTQVQPGYVGVVVDQLGSDKGVEENELHVGFHFIPPWKSVYLFPIFEQNHIWEENESFSFQTSEGLAVSADVGITYHIDAASVPFIFQKYRRGMAEINSIFIRNNVRDAINKSASKMKIEDLYGLSKETFFDEVQQYVKRDLNSLGFKISKIYLIGRFNFPQNVVAALNQKIEATQRAQQRENELRETEAQAKKQIAMSQGEAQCRILEAQAQATSITAKANANAQALMILAEAEAKANKMLAASLDANLIQSQAIKQWNGQLPNYNMSDKLMFLQGIK
jgi:regulator of protease activity HflC (stomatin/prohibitin superfamily)